MEKLKWSEVSEWESAKLFAKIEQHLIESRVINPDAGEVIEVAAQTDKLLRIRIKEVYKDAHGGDDVESLAVKPELENILNGLTVSIDEFKNYSYEVVKDEDGDYIEILLLDIPADTEVVS